MSVASQNSIALVGVGGVAPYVYTIVAGGNTTIPATISGSTLTVDASTLEPGTYSVEIQITDQAGSSTTKIISVNVMDQTKFAIVNQSLTYEPNTFPYAAIVPLAVTGGTGSIFWSLLPGVTTLPNASISGSTLSFTLNAFGRWTVGLRATDSLNNTVTKVIEVAVESASVVTVVDGHALLSVTPSSTEVGAHQFTIAVTDSALASKKATFSYKVDNVLSSLDVEETAIDHVWGSGDATEMVYPITGNLAGFAIGSGTAITAANGLSITVDPATGSIQVSGPPTSFGNAEVLVPIPIMQGATQVATLARDFTLISHNTGTGMGSMTCRTRTYIVGELVGLNPQRPYFNSPSIFKNANLTAQLATNSTLPQGLSLDSVTGLVYGTVLAADVATSVLQYVDSTGTTQGAITIIWDIVKSNFQLIDNLPDGQLQSTYSGTLTASSSTPLVSASVHRGTLPSGLTLAISPDKTTVTLSGAPTTAGYFDLWLAVTNSNSQTAYIQKRLVIDYVAPLVVLTDQMQPLTSNAGFTQTLMATGGVAPYTWAITGGALPSGLALNASSGVISGTTQATSYSQTIVVQVTDSRGVMASRALPFTLDNTLAITTTTLPLITPGQMYQFNLQARGGQGAYTWALGASSAALPGGITLSSSGLLSGATSLQSYSETITVQVTDAANNVAVKTYAFMIGVTSGMTIDTEGVGPLVRGQAYQGRLLVLGSGQAPFQWYIAPDSPNQLPAGMTLTTDQSDQGVTATLAGTTMAFLLNDAVKVQVVDANGNTATAFLMLNTYSALTITTASLPQGTVGGDYSVQLACSGANAPFTWTLDPTSPALPAGMTLSSSGVLTGPPTATADVNLVFRVTDALGDYAIKTLELVVVVSTLAITSTSLPQGVAGVAYSTQLAATGGNTPYTWSISPASASLLPAGLTLDPSTGTISGTTLAAGFSKLITVRVTDAIHVYREATFPLTIINNLQLTAGPDYVMGTSLNILGVVAKGDVNSINPRSNLSFCVVATNCVSASASGIGITVPSGFSASVASYSGGTAVITLSGAFAGGSVGSNSLPVSVSDSGLNVSKTFSWNVYSQNAITIVPSSGSLPVQYQ